MRLKSGEVVVDRFNSHLKESVLPHLPAALAQISSGGRGFFVEEVDFGRPIGETVCVATTDADEIFWAKRPRRFGHTRFVKNRAPESCSSVVVILKTADGEANTYVMVTAFVGHRPEPEPWDRNFSQQADPQEAERLSRDFWSSHALVWGSEKTIPGTETTVCPW